ncbi:hypothetical protein B0H19DRAFT_1105054 [Mycena capillaripes]|nr:hypothetical protein B0H19DRAFT_1105054 [Mycena capillaripes]
MSTASSTPPFSSAQFPGVPTGTQQFGNPNSTSTDSVGSGSGPSVSSVRTYWPSAVHTFTNHLDFGVEYYILGSLVGILVVGLLLCLRWRIPRRRAGLLSPSEENLEIKPPLYDAYLEQHEASGDIKSRWEDIMPLAMSPIPLGICAPPTTKGPNIAPLLRARVSVLVHLPVPKQNEQRLGDESPLLDIGMLELDLPFYFILIFSRH